MGNNSVYTLTLSVKAEKEIINSYDWYEDQQKSLGDRFIKEVFHCINRIEQNPELFSTKVKSYREANINTFPFVIIYRINKSKKTVRIVSVFHTSRNTKIKYI